MMLRQESEDAMHKYAVIFVTCSSRDEAEMIADKLLTKKLVACANLIPGIESWFWWKGKIDTAKEVLLVLKARSGSFKKIEAEVKKLHSYDVPEIIALPIGAGSKKYLAWIGSIG